MCAYARQYRDAHERHDGTRLCRLAPTETQARSRSIELHRADGIELAMAPQGTRLEISGELAGLIIRTLAEQNAATLPQLAYLSTATFPSSNLVPGSCIDERLLQALRRRLATDPRCLDSGSAHARCGRGAAVRRHRRAATAPLRQAAEAPRSSGHVHGRPIPAYAALARRMPTRCRRALRSSARILGSRE